MADNKNEPPLDKIPDQYDTLWLPSGSVRALLALSLVLAYILFLFIHQTCPEAFTNIIYMVLGFYFGAKLK